MKIYFCWSVRGNFLQMTSKNQETLKSIPSNQRPLEVLDKIIKEVKRHM